MKRNINIDFLKAISIMFVILMHSLPVDKQMQMGRPFIFMQAVPIFMILFGYNSTGSLNRNGFTEKYNWGYILRKIRGLLIPYTLIWISEFFYFTIVDNYSVGQLIYSYFTGGEGTGGYFILIMVQAVFLSPILFKVINSYDKLGLLAIFVINVLLESASVGVAPENYRLMITRYIFAIALGIYLAKNKDKIKISRWVPLAFVSLLYIYAVEYNDQHFLIEHLWTSQHFPVYFWTFLIVYFVMKVPFKNEHPLINRIGESSYFIFLIQKVYFIYIWWLLPGIGYKTNTVLSLIVCTVVGIGLFYLYKKVTNVLLKMDFKSIFIKQESAGQ